MLSPEDLAGLSTEGYFLLALDATGVAEVAAPPNLAARFASWRDSPWVNDESDDPLSMIAEPSQPLVVGTFLRAIKQSNASCIAELHDGANVLLSFWDRFNDDGVMLVVGHGPFGGSLHSAATLPAAPPLRCLVTLNVFGVIEAIDDSTTELLGWGHEVIGRPITEFQPGTAAGSQGFDVWEEILRFPERHFGGRACYRAASGVHTWCDFRTVNKLASNGNIEVELVDVSEHIHGPARSSVPIALADIIAGTSSAGVAVVDQNLTVVAYNEKFIELTGVLITPADRRLILPPTREFRGVASRIAHALSEPSPDDGPQCWDLDGCAMDATPYVVGAERFVVVTATGKRRSRDLPLEKGLTEPTLALILRCLDEADGSRGLSYLEVAEASGVSEVTARRYVTFLLEQGVVEVALDYGQRGRPRRRFRRADQT